MASLCRRIRSVGDNRKLLSIDDRSIPMSYRAIFYREIGEDGETGGSGGETTESGLGFRTGEKATRLGRKSVFLASSGSEFPESPSRSKAFETIGLTIHSDRPPIQQRQEK